MSGLQGFAAEGAWIRQRLTDGWVKEQGPPAPLTPISWDNAAFDPPDPPAPYLRYSVQHSDGRQASVGPRPMERHDGMVVLEIFVPAGSQTAVLDALCDRAAEIFRGARAAGLRFYTPRAVRVGGSGSWFRKNVLCPFQRDTVFTPEED